MGNLERELRFLVVRLNKELDKSTKDLGKKSLDYMRKQYMEDKNNMSSHVGNITLKPYNKRFKNGFIISSGNDEIAIYNEFGTGIVGEGTNPLASSAKPAYKYNVESPYKGKVPDAAHAQYTNEYLETVNTPNTWWYFKNGRWWHTEGMKGKNMYSSLVDILKDVGVRDLKAKISQTIGDYNSNGGKNVSK